MHKSYCSLVIKLVYELENPELKPAARFKIDLVWINALFSNNTLYLLG